jgi:hypothetical protein
MGNEVSFEAIALAMSFDVRVPSQSSHIANADAFKVW